jgi:YrbI family 3-deoxy-D-manno-octulosonate 8-phosphate phosphatase
VEKRHANPSGCEKLGQMKQTIAVIPARGGSKGLPGKNLRHVGGLPLVARAVQAARAASLVSRVFVSTDSPSIAGIAMQYGSEIIWRPENISDDLASSESALLHALDYLVEREKYTPDILVFLQCTSPFLSAADIDDTVRIIFEEQADSAFAAAPFHHFLWKQDANGNALGINHSGLRQRRQDREPEYLEAGSVYAMRVETFRAEGNRFCGRQQLCITPSERLFEIDDLTDLTKAQAIAPILDRQDQLKALPTSLSAIVFDFDGVFTDNSVFVDQSGLETVLCSRSDGMGIELLRARSVPMLVISKEQNSVVAQRCRKLQIPCMQGIDDKVTALDDWLAANGYSTDHVIYMGNDINDLECLQKAACAVGPRDSHWDILPVLQIRLSADGGRGAVREIADLICQAIDEGRISLLPSQQ